MFMRSLAILMTMLLMSAATPAAAQTLDKAERACASAKLKATAKKAAAKMKCEAVAISKELSPTDPDCLSKAETKFNQAFTKAEEKGGCVSEGDAAAVETAVDDFVSGEVERQKTGGSPNTFPCSTLLQPCGSCAGGGVCVSTPDGDLTCIMQPSGTPVLCTSDSQCSGNTFCAGVSPTYYCLAGCS